MTVRSPMLEKALTLMLLRSPLNTAPLHTDTCAGPACTAVCSPYQSALDTRTELPSLQLQPQASALRVKRFRLGKGSGVVRRGLTLSNRSTSPMTTASGAIQVSGARVGVRLPRVISCRCLQRKRYMRMRHPARLQRSISAVACVQHSNCAMAAPLSRQSPLQPRKIEQHQLHAVVHRSCSYANQGWPPHMQYGMSAMCSDAAAALMLITLTPPCPIPAASEQTADVTGKADEVAALRAG